MPRHHATAGGMVISLFSAENRLQAQISNFLKQVTKTISLEDFFSLFPRGRENVYDFKTSNNFSLFKYILI